MTIPLIKLAMLIVFIVSSTSCTAIKKDVVGIVSIYAKKLSTALTASGLNPSLKETGPFTVFAPTDGAFEEIEADLNNLLKPENKIKLSNVLKCHVINGKIMTSDLTDGQELTSLDGSKIKITMMGNGKIMVGDAHITVSDLAATNGVVHMIDKVILAPKPISILKDIVDLASENVKTLATALTAADLTNLLRGPGPFTIFAPSDAAFTSIQSEVDILLKPENKTKLTKILTYHVVSGKTLIGDLRDGQIINLAGGSTLFVSIKNGMVMINDAQIISSDLLASNGVIHVIDKVLKPKK